MVDIAAIAGLMNSIKVALDLSKAALEVRDSTVTDDQLWRLQREMIAIEAAARVAHADYLAMVEKVSALEKALAECKERVAQRETWQAEKAQYQMAIIGPGATAYVLKPGAEAGEPPHWICAGCHAGGRKSILQFETRSADNARSIYRCAACRSTVTVPYRRNPSNTPG